MADLKFSKIKLTLDGKQVELGLETIRKKAEQTAAAMKGMKPDSKEWKAAKKNLDALHSAEEDMIPTLERVNHYMKEIGKTATTDLGRALREVTKLRDAMPGDHKDLDKVNNIIDLFKDWQKQNRGLGLTFEKAKKQLTDLTNVSPDKLRQGLAAINKEMEKTTSPTTRERYQGWIKQYEAQIAVNEYGRAGHKDIKAMNDVQLRNEQSRLRSAYMATEGAQGYETISNEYITRLQQVNQLIRARTDAEQKYLSTQRKAKEDQEKYNAAVDTYDKLIKGEKVSLEDLTNAQKTFNAELQSAKGVDDTLATALEGGLNKINNAIDTLNGKRVDVAKIINDPGATLEQMETALKQLEAEASKLGANMDRDIEKNAQQTELLTQRMSELKNKMKGIADLDFTNLENVPTEKLTAALEDLERQEKKLAGTQKLEAQEVAIKKAAIQRQLLQNKIAAQDFARAEKVAADTGKYNVTQLQQAYDMLKLKLTTLKTGETEAIEKTRAQMRRLKDVIDETTGSISSQSSIWRTAVRNITAYVGVFGVFNLAKSKIQELIHLNAQYSDSLADIRKVAQVSMDEVNELSRAIAKIDTRTTIDELAKISYAGAKLGMSQYGVGGMEAFTRAANQLNVALKEDLGDEALTAVAKLTENMGLIKNMGVEKAMTATSSAIFKLAATSTASGGPIVEFSKRLAAVAGQAGITTDQLLGMASAADSMMLMPEVASTAFNKMITAMQTNHNLIENQLNITKGTINDLFSQGRMMDAVVLVFEKMKEMGNMNALKPIFKDLGSDGARLNMVMTAMAKNVDMLKDHLFVAQEAFEQGTAVTEEYNIQQETAQALMERAANLFEKAFVNPEGVDLAKQFAQALYNISEELTRTNMGIWALTQLMKFLFLTLESVVRLLPAIISGLGAYGLIGLFHNLGVTAKTAGGFITMLTTSIRGLSMATKLATGVGIFVAALEGLVWAMNKFKDEAKDFKVTQDEIRSSLSDGFRSANEATMHLNAYKKVLEDVNTTEKDRERILKKFNYEYRGYLNKLGLEVKSVGDLQAAYAALNDELRKERYYKMQNQLIESKTAPVIQQGADAVTRYNAIMNKRYGKAGGFDATYIREHQDEGLETLYKRILSAQYGGGGTFTDKGHYVTKAKFGNKTYNIDNPGDRELAEAIGDIIHAFRQERDITKDVIQAFKPYVGDYDPVLKQVLGTLDNEAPDKAELAAAKKAQQDAKQAARKELKDAETETNAIIAKVEEWYTLQQTAVTEAYNEGRITEQKMTTLNQQLEQAKNTALAAARRSLSGQDTQTWNSVKAQIGELMFDQGEWSKELLTEIFETNMKALRNALMKFDGKKSLDQWGFTSTAFRDSLNKNAAKNDAKVKEIDAKMRQQVEAFLLQYDYINQAFKSFSTQLENLGILTETAKQMADKMRRATDLNPSYTEKDFAAEQQNQEQMRRKALSAFIAQGSKPYAVNPKDTQALRDWLADFTEAQFGGVGENGMEFKFNSWAQTFGADFNLWLKDAEKYKSSIQKFFMSLLAAEDDYYKKRKEAYNAAKTHLDQSMQAAGWTDKYNEAETELGGLASIRKINGEGTNFLQQHGLQDQMAEDPEIKAIQLRIAMRQKEYEEAKALGESQQLIAEKQNEMLAAQADLAEKVGNGIADRISKLKELTAPLEEFGEEVGQKLGDALFSLESTSDSWSDITKKMILSVSKMTLQMGSQYLQQKLQQALTNKAMEAQEMIHQQTMTGITVAGGMARVVAEETTNAEILTATDIADSLRISKEAKVAAIMAAFGVSQGAAKTIAALGFWGIPLIGVITSVLMGLLSSALSTAGKSDSNSSSSKIKLVSGMLTYDEGNVGQYVGSDGHVYSARQQSSIPEGVSLVQQPIATTVNGQPSLVAEKGPEIVIGRRTTRQIMMNEPGLIRTLANYGRGGVRRLYDEGNIGDVLAINPTSGSSPARGGEYTQLDGDTVAALKALPGVMSALTQQLKKPVHINMFGEDSLDESMEQRDAYRRRYPRG